MLSGLAVPHFTELTRAVGVLQPEAKSIQMFSAKPRDSACQCRDCSWVQLLSPLRWTVPAGLPIPCYQGRDDASALGSAGCWCQRDVGKLVFE